MLMCGARATASRWLRAGTTSTRVRSAPRPSRARTTPSVSAAQAGTTVETRRSSAVFLPTQAIEKTRAATRRLRRSLASPGTPSRAASRTAGANSSANRSTFVPTGEAIRYVRTVPAAYTAPLNRATRQVRGASAVTASPSTTGGQTRAAGINCSPVNGKRSMVAPTTAAGGRSRASARPQSRTTSRAAPTTTRNRPATGLAMVASAAYATARAIRRSRVRSTQAARPRATPRAKVVRPEATLHHRARDANSAGPSGFWTPERIRRTAASQDAASPETTVTVRTPRPAIRYGEIRL